MEQLLEFVSNHPVLVGLFVALAVALTVNILMDPGGKDAVDPSGATDLINHQDAVVVDVRSIKEFRDGHIINSINIPLNGFESQLKALDKHKGKPIVVSCQSGSRSSSACRLLRDKGFENVHNLRGGIMAWQNANLPISRKG